MTEAKPLPLSAEQIEEIREYHLGPAIPGACADGQQITSESCPKCHAKSNQTCGRWVTKTEKHVVALLGHITSLQAENAANDAAYKKAHDDISANYDALLKRLEDAEAEVERLKALVHVPGAWRCAKCKFTVHKMVMCASSGNVGVKADTKTELCPNGCGPLWPYTERQAGNDAIDRLEEAFEREKTLKSEVERLRQNQRTPGTVEVCSQRMIYLENPTKVTEYFDCGRHPHMCVNAHCPLRSQEKK
jgi:hypothetical protein